MCGCVILSSDAVHFGILRNKGDFFLNFSFLPISKLCEKFLTKNNKNLQVSLSGIKGGACWKCF